MKLESGKWYDIDGSRWQFVRAMRCSESSIKKAGYGGRFKPDPHGRMMFFFTCKSGPGRGEYATGDVSKARLAKEQSA